MLTSIRKTSTISVAAIVVLAIMAAASAGPQTVLVDHPVFPWVLAQK